jgi:ribosomal protein S27AE
MSLDPTQSRHAYEPEVPVEELLKPNAHRRCCGALLQSFAGRLHCGRCGARFDPLTFGRRRRAGS